MRKFTSILWIVVLSLIFNHTVIARNDVTDNISNPKIPVLQESASLYPAGILDTLRWVDNGDINFGGWSGDYFATYFAFPANGILHSIILTFSDLPDTTGGSFTLWICDNHYPWPDFDPAEIRDEATAWLGYYSTNYGYSAFGQNKQWQRGLINSIADSAKIYNPLGDILWPDTNGITIEIDPDATDIRTYQIQLKDYSESSLYFSDGDTLFILIRFNGFEDKNNDPKYRFGCFSGIHPVEHPFLKFYNNTGTPSGRMGNEDFGWYIRSYIPNWACAVEYASGPRPFFIRNITQLHWTYSSQPRDVYAQVYYNPLNDIDSVMLYYSTDKQHYTGVHMNLIDPDKFEYKGTIPGFNPRTEVSYYAKAFSFDGQVGLSFTFTYEILDPDLSKDLLVILDGIDPERYNIPSYLFGNPDYHIPFTSDVWGYGPTPAYLLNEYDIILEITSNVPQDSNATAIMNWLKNGNKCYMLAGDEVLGLYYGWPGVPLTIPTGNDSLRAADSLFDYLGIQTYYSDINYCVSDDYLLPWMINPVNGDVISGSIAELMSSLAIDTLLTDPFYSFDQTNFIDAVGVDEDAITAFTSIPNQVYAQSYGTNPLTVGFHKFDPVLNNKLVFLGFDPHSVTGAPDQWWGASPAGPVTQALKWFGLWKTDEFKLGSTITVHEFNLHPNYPNPFNPTTTISFELPKETYTEINIYNLAGQLVQTLVNEVKPAGRHQLIWDAGDLPSGIYFYQIKVEDHAGNGVQTKKCILLK